MSASASIMHRLKEADARVEFLDFSELYIVMTTGDILPITGAYDEFDNLIEDPDDHVEDIVDVEFGGPDYGGYGVMHNHRPGNFSPLESQ